MYSSFLWLASNLLFPQESARGGSGSSQPNKLGVACIYPPKRKHVHFV